MDSVFVVMHVHTLPGGAEDVKMIGVYRSVDAAKLAIRRLSVMPGFVEHPTIIDPDTTDESDGFFISQYQLDSDHWGEGFFTTD